MVNWISWKFTTRDMHLLITIEWNRLKVFSFFSIIVICKILSLLDLLSELEKIPGIRKIQYSFIGTGIAPWSTNIHCWQPENDNLNIHEKTNEEKLEFNEKNLPTKKMSEDFYSTKAKFLIPRFGIVFHAYLSFSAVFKCMCFFPSAPHINQSIDDFPHSRWSIP